MGHYLDGGFLLVRRAGKAAKCRRFKRRHFAFKASRVVSEFDVRAKRQGPSLRPSISDQALGRRKEALKLYSFDTNDFAMEPATDSFAADGFHNELETFLTKQVESALNDLRAQLQRGDAAVDVPCFYRAAIPVVSLQRILYLLDKSLSWKGKRFVPIAIPLDPQRALILYSLGLGADLSTRNGMREVVATHAPQLIEDASAGMDTATRVAVPPGLSGSEKDLAAQLQQARKKNKAAIAYHNVAVSPSARSGES